MSLRQSVIDLLGTSVGKRQPLMRGTIGSLLIKCSYILLQFGVSVLLARTLGAAEFGSYSFALAVATLVLIPAQLGFAGYLVRMAAIYQGDEKYALLKGLLARSGQIVAILAVALAAGAALVFSLVDVESGGHSSKTLLLALALVPLLALLLTSGGALRGLGYVVVSQVPEQIIRPAALLLMLLMMREMISLTPDAAMIANLGATTLALFVGANNLHRRVPAPCFDLQSRHATTEWVRGAFPFMLLASAQIINHQADILMLGVMMSADQVGQYRVAIQIADALVVVLMAISTAITPQLAKLHAKGDWDAIRRVLVSSHRVGFVVLCPLVGLFAVAGRPILETLFGREYGESAGALLILVAGKAFYAAVGFCGVALSMFGYASIAMVATILTALVNVAMNLVLIPLMGIDGAAVATAASALGVNATLAIWMKRHFGPNLSAFGALPPAPK